MKRSVLLFLLTVVGVLLTDPIISAPSAPSPADPIYQQALSSFLAGDYDKALVQSAQALEKDPTHQRTRNLINVLAAEKEQDGKTVIWLAGKPALVPAPGSPGPALVREDAGLRNDIEALKQKVEVYYQGALGRQEGIRGQIKAVQDLVRDNSQTQYREVRSSQEAIYEKLEALEKAEGGQDLTILYLLCGASILLSLLALIRKTQKG